MINDGTLTFAEECEILTKDAINTLAEYSVSEKDTEKIVGMIATGFYHASGCAASGRAMERIFEEYCHQDGKCYCELSEPEQMTMYAKYRVEEESKYPFGHGAEDDEDEA